MWARNGDDATRAEQLRAHNCREPNRTSANDCDNVTRCNSSVEYPHLIARTTTTASTARGNARHQYSLTNFAVPLSRKSSLLLFAQSRRCHRATSASQRSPTTHARVRDTRMHALSCWVARHHVVSRDSRIGNEVTECHEQHHSEAQECSNARPQCNRAHHRPTPRIEQQPT